MLSFLAVLVSLGGGHAEPARITFKVTGSDVTRAGADTSLGCMPMQAGGGIVPLPVFTWFKDGRPLPGQSGYLLRLNHVTKQDEGFYQCGGPGSTSGGDGLQLHVYASGDVLPQPSVYSDKFAVEGRPLSLTCHMRYYVVNDKTVFTWYKDSTEVKGQTGQVWQLPPLTEADEGKYTCTVREGPVTSTSPPSLGLHLSLMVSPNVTIEPPSPDLVVKGALGNTLNLTCKVIRANPRVLADGYSWSYLPSPQGQLRPLAGKTNTLTLGSLTREDRGQYFCQARNDRDFEDLNLIGNASVTVDVVYLENFSMTPDLEIIEGDPVTLTCRVDSHPTAKLVWTVNGQEVRQVTDNVDHYVIPSAACSDSNNYTCGASNPDLPGVEIHATVQLTVLCRQATTEDHTMVSPGKTTDFTPELADAKGVPWMIIGIVLTAFLGIITAVVVGFVLFWFRLTETQRERHLVKVFKYLCPSQFKEAETQQAMQDHTVVDMDSVSQQESTASDERSLLLERTESQDSMEGPATVDIDNVSHQESTASDERSHLLEGNSNRVQISTSPEGTGVRKRHVKRQQSADINGLELREPVALVLRRTRSMSESKTVPPIQGQKVSFDNVYKNGKVYVLPLLQDKDSKGIVVKRLYQVLSMAVRHGDPPVFLCTESLPCYMHAIVYHKLYGVIVVKRSTLASIDEAAHSQLKHAAKELVNARKRLTKELQGLLHPDGVTLLLALPNLKDNEDLSEKDWAWLQDRNIHVLVGKTKGDYLAWLQTLPTKEHKELWGLGGDSDHAFRTAVSSFLSMKSYGDDSDPPTWLVTQEQASVLQCTDKLLHVWGPPGSGKTLLLVDRVRRWLSRGKIVVLAVCSPYYELLLHRLAKISVEGLPNDTTSSLKLCKSLKELKKAIALLGEITQPSEICVAIDAIKNDFLPVLLDVYSSSIVESAWTTSRADFPKSKEFQKLEGRSACLSRCLRSSATLQDLARKVMPHGAVTAPWTDPPHPDTSASLYPPLITVELHPSHLGNQAGAFPNFDCGKCDVWLKKSLPLSLQDHEQWKHWVVLLTGDWSSDSQLTEKLVSWLRREGVPAVHEWRLHDRVSSASTSTLASSDEMPQDTEDRAELRARVVSSVDKDGRPAVHVMRGSLFRGLEKPCVLVVHYDWRDDHPDEKSKRKQNSRLAQHRYQLFRATIRCQAVLAVLLLSPSPAASLLPLKK